METSNENGSRFESVLLTTEISQSNFFKSTVIQALIALVNDPEPEHPLRADVAEEFQKDRKKFNKAAEEFTRKHSEKRPNE